MVHKGFEIRNTTVGYMIFEKGRGVMTTTDSENAAKEWIEVYLTCQVD